MVDDARWNHVAIDVGDHVSTHNHCYVLFVECVHHSGEGIFVFVHVVAIELNDKLTSLFVVSSEVPVATDTHIVVVSDDVDQAWVVSKFVDCFTSTVGREVIYHHEVELEVGLLVEHALDSVADSADTVTNRNHNGCFHFKFATVEFNVLEVWSSVFLNRSEVTTDFLEVFGTSLFHFNLTATVLRIYVVENLFTTLAGVELHVAVEEFVDVGDSAELRELQTEVVQTSELIVSLHCFSSFLEAASAEEEH